MSIAHSPARVSGNRHVEFRHPISTFQKANPSTSFGDLPQPLEAANKVSAGYIETLHIGLQSFLTALSQKCLTAYSVYHYYNLKSREMSLHPHQIPTSVKKLKLILQPLDEVKESEGYKALQSELDVEMDTIHRKLTEKYVKPLDTMNSKAHLKRFQLAVCHLLRNATKGFMAQLDIKNYDVDTAVIDFLAQAPMDLFSSSLPKDLPSILWLYKEAHDEIAQLPFPSNSDGNIRDIITHINNNTQPTPVDTVSIRPQAGTDRQAPSPSIASTLTGSDEPPNANDNANTEAPSNLSNHTPRTQRLSLTEPVADSEGTRQRITPGTATQSLQLDGSTPLPPYPSVEETTRPEGSPPEAANGILGTPFTPAATLLNRFSYSPLPGENEGEVNPEDPTPQNNFTSQELSEKDLESITMAVEQDKLRKMIHKLYIYTVQLPIKEFHSIINQRDELQRIKRITTPALQSCLTTKVAATIQAERPADRPVLAGLIREETEKTTASLRQQLKSATDQLDYVRKQQALILSNTHINNSKQRSRKHSKNSMSGNNNEVQAGSTGNGTLTVAAATSTSAPSSASTVSLQSLPQPHSSGTRKRKQHPHSDPSRGLNSTVAVDNVTAARRRKNKKSWQRPKPQRNEQS